jgi:hypothetical protein
MAHHKHSGGSSSRVENKRIDHKRARAAAQQALDGGYIRVVHSSNWGVRVPQPPVLDVASTRGRKKGARVCKRNKGAAHTPIYRHSGNWRKVGWFCACCNKRLWGYRPPNAPRSATDNYEHMLMENIVARLAGLPCKCSRCKTSD